LSRRAEAIEFVSPFRGWNRFLCLPRAYALPGSPTRAVFARWGGLGYLLDAPPALRYFAHGDMDRLYSHVEFLKRA
jgi:hypothetical protein